MFKALKSLLAVTNSALEVTTSVLNEVNDGLNSMNKSLESYSERRKFLKDLCRLVFENKLTRNEAIQQIQEKIGDEYISEFDDYLQRYCETECKTAIYKIFPHTKPIKNSLPSLQRVSFTSATQRLHHSNDVDFISKQYFKENNENLFRNRLFTKYGEISQKIFDNELKERRKYIINYLIRTDESLSLSSRYALENLNNDELNIAFWKKKEEIEKKLKEFEQKTKEFDTKVEQLFKSTGK